MTPDEALDIIGDYGGAIAKGDIRRLSYLPCSKAKIKQAYFTYLPALYEAEGGFYQEPVENLVQCYGMLSQFVDDEQADQLENIKAKMDSKKIDYSKNSDKELAKEYFAYMQTMRDETLIDEINEYIQEIQERGNK